MGPTNPIMNSLSETVARRAMLAIRIRKYAFPVLEYLMEKMVARRLFIKKPQ
jgi:hypothetical protein